LAFSDLCSKNSILVTFGSPRVGNIAYANFVNTIGRSWRIYNTEDLITTLPLPINAGYIYEHLKSSIAFTINFGNYVDNHIQAYSVFLDDIT